MKIQEYIDSGILETFVLGVASEEEVKQLLYMKTKYPEVNEALQQLEQDMEKLAADMAITPPPGTWYKIEKDIEAIIPHQENTPQLFKNGSSHKSRTRKGNDEYIEVEGESSHMRLHKAWRWVFAAVFILGKIFLGFAIYFYLENKHTQEQIQELKTEIRQLKNK